MNIHIPHGQSHTPLGPQPVRIRCPSCSNDIVTNVKSEPTKNTHLIALLLCVFCLWCFAWIPYVKDTCQNRNHYCPNCNAYIGTFTNS